MVDSDQRRRFTQNRRGLLKEAGLVGLGLLAGCVGLNATMFMLGSSDDQSGSDSANDGGTGVPSSDGGDGYPSPPSNNEEPKNLVPQTPDGWEQLGTQKFSPKETNEKITQADAGIIASYEDQENSQYLVSIVRWSSQSHARKQGSLLSDPNLPIYVVHGNFGFGVAGDNDAMMVKLLANSPTLTQEYIKNNNLLAETPTPVPDPVDKVTILTHEWTTTEVGDTAYKDNIKFRIRNDADLSLDVSIRLTVVDTEGGRITGYTKDIPVRANQTLDWEFRPEGSYGDFENATYELEIVDARTNR